MPKAGTTRRVYMVELFVDIDGYPTFSFFTSKKAITDFFGDALGIGHSYLKTVSMKDAPFANRMCRIIEGTMRSAKQDIIGNKETSEKIRENFKRLEERKKQEEQL